MTEKSSKKITGYIIGYFFKKTIDKCGIREYYEVAK